MAISSTLSFSSVVVDTELPSRSVDVTVNVVLPSSSTSASTVFPSKSEVVIE